MAFQETSFFDLPPDDKDLKGLVYLISPFTHVIPEVQEMRYALACRAVKEYFMLGVHAISAIVHCYPVAQKHHLPGNYDFWKSFNKEMIKASSTTRVLKIPGWDTSTGVEQEIVYSHRFQKPIAEVGLYQSVHRMIDMAWELK
jgi:hypothetical protein